MFKAINTGTGVVITEKETPYAVLEVAVDYLKSNYSPIAIFEGDEQIGEITINATYHQFKPGQVQLDKEVQS